MPIYLLGDQGGGVPFGRNFFNLTLGDIIAKGGKSDSQRLHLFLTDGTTLEVCQIEQLAEQYMVVRAYNSEETQCDLLVNVIPYGLIYRIQIVPKGVEEERVGFRWLPPKPEPTKVPDTAVAAAAQKVTKTAKKGSK
jgi:hypothetical protein